MMPATRDSQAPIPPPKDQRTVEEQRRDEWLKGQAAHRVRQTPPPAVQPLQNGERQAISPSPTPKKKEKQDWGDGDMSSLL